MLTQEVFLFSTSILENIRMGNPQASDEQVKAAAKAVGADAFIERLRDGYDSLLGRGGTSLSAGQRQLVSFARVFLCRSASADSDEATAFAGYSERTRRAEGPHTVEGRTALVIAHRLDGAQRRPRAGDSGWRRGRGWLPQQLIAAGGRFAAMYASWDELNRAPEEGE